MWDKLKQFFAPPVVTTDQEMAHTARLLYIVVWLSFVASLLGSFMMMLGQPGALLAHIVRGGVLVAVFLGLRAALYRGYARHVAWLMILWVWAIVTYFTIVTGGIRGIAAMAYYLVILEAGLLLGANATIVLGLLCAGSIALVFFLERVGLIAGIILSPTLGVDWATFEILIMLEVLLLQTSLREFQRWNRRLRQSEAAVAERNRDLQASREAQIAYTHNVERRFAYLEATTRVTWETATTLDLTSLWERLVNLICDEFAFYHVALLLLDETGHRLRLQAASGAAGQSWLARGYQLELSEAPDLEGVARRGETRIYRADDSDRLTLPADLFNNPDLPEARAILWLPLRQVQDGEVFGVLGLYSREKEAFDTQDMLVLQALADQSAMVINHARLFAELQESLQIAERAFGRATRESWQHWVRAEVGRVYRYTGETASAGPVEGAAPLPELLLPLRVRGQVLGQIVAHKAKGAWTAEENAMLETLLAQLEQALDSARLYEVTQRRALREQLTREITDHIRASLTVEEAMRRAVEEVARVLRATETVGRIGAERTLFPSAEAHNHE